MTMIYILYDTIVQRLSKIFPLVWFGLNEGHNHEESEQMYPYLLLVERKEAEFYHNIDRMH